MTQENLSEYIKQKYGVDTLPREEISDDVIISREIAKLRESKEVEAPKREGSVFSQIGGIQKFALRGGLGGMLGMAEGEIGAGILKTIPSTTKGMLNLAEKLGGGGKTPISNLTTPAFRKFEEKITTPSNILQQVGFVAGEIAQFLAPIPGFEKVKAIGLLPRIFTEAAEAGIKTAAQTGEVDKDVRTNALLAAAFPTAGALLKQASPFISSVMKKTGQKIQKIVIKPNAKDIENGFKIENVEKYNLGGTLEEIMVKTESSLNKYWGILQSKLQGAKIKNAVVNLNNVFYKTLQQLKQIAFKSFGDLQSIDRVTTKLANEIDEVSGKTGMIDILEAQSVKQGAGTKGAWVFGTADPDASATELVYDIFYKNIKTAIEDAARKAGIKGIDVTNKAMSELIPIKSALIRRMPVAERNQILGLGDKIHLLGSIFNPRALALYGVDRLLRSGKFANFLVKASENFKKLKGAVGMPGTPESRVFGGSVEKPGIAGFGIEDVSKLTPEEKAARGFNPPAVGETAKQLKINKQTKEIESRMSELEKNKLFNRTTFLDGKQQPIQIKGYHIPREEGALEKIQKEGFSLEKFGSQSGTKEAGDPRGIYFFPKKSDSNVWKEMLSEEGQYYGTIKSNLSIKKPFEIKTASDEVAYFAVVKKATGTKAESLNAYRGIAQPKDSEKITKWFEKMGYDAIIDKKGLLSFNEPQIIIFNPNNIGQAQIKAILGGASLATIALASPFLGNDQNVSVAIKTSIDSIKEGKVGKQTSISFYQPKKEQTDSTPRIGSFGREMKWGDVALGNRAQEKQAKQKYRNNKLDSHIFIPELEHIKTPYGNGIFRVNDTMNPRYAETNNIDIFIPKEKEMDLKKEFDRGRISGRYGFINLN